MRAILLGSLSFRLRFTSFLFLARLFFLRHIFALNFSASDPAHYLFPRRRSYFFDKSRLHRCQCFLLKLVLCCTMHIAAYFSAAARFSSDISFLARIALRFAIFYPEAPCRAISSLLCCRSLRPWISRPPLRNFYSRPLWNSRILGRFRF